jgi:hypothetical protein
MNTTCDRRSFERQLKEQEHKQAASFAEERTKLQKEVCKRQLCRALTSAFSPPLRFAA